MVGSVGDLKAGKSGRYILEGVWLRAEETFNLKLQRDRLDVFVESVAKGHPEATLLQALVGKPFWIPTFLANFESYPRDKLCGDALKMADSLEALWRLLRRHLVESKTKPAPNRAERATFTVASKVKDEAKRKSRAPQFRARKPFGASKGATIH